MRALTKFVFIVDSLEALFKVQVILFCCVTPANKEGTSLKSSSATDILIYARQPNARNLPLCYHLSYLDKAAQAGASITTLLFKALHMRQID